jgi:tRNA(Arg) A34 adenosine deaminase TadA
MRSKFVSRVVHLAEEALNKGSFPNGALLVKGDNVICDSISMSEQVFDPTAHAEISVIREVCKRKETNTLSGYTLYT